jgi:HAD superfamily hydrolase (TIGR01509 family)
VDYRALVFDLDGTVVDSHRYTFDAFRFACEPFRHPPTDAEVFAAFGPSEEVILGGLLPAAVRAAAYARLQAYYTTHAGRLAVHPAMRPLLGACRDAAVRCGLFTGRGADSTRIVLAALDLDWAFAAVVAGDQAARPKPAPDGLLRLLEMLECAPADGILVGDSSLDIQAARAAGVAAVFAAWHPWVGSAPPAGVPVLDHPDDLRALVGLPPAGALGDLTGPEP